MYTYAGNIHIHTRYSDGSGTVPEIVAAANKAGLDYIIITDHHNREAASDEGIHGNVAVIAGMELNKASNHYLAIGDLSINEDYTEDPQKGIDEVNRQGGLGFLAHPFEKGSPLVTDGAAFPWTDWSVDGYTGVELWNYSSQWKGEAQSIVKTLAWFILNRDAPHKNGPMPECIKKWDELCINRKVVAIGGTDAHAIPFRIGLYKTEVFPYYDLFRSINTYIVLTETLSRQFNEAKIQIINALKEGRCYISFDRWGSGRGLMFKCKNKCNEFVMGSELEWSEGTILEVKAPRGRSLIRIIKNGSLVYQSKGNNATYKVKGPGIYRTEVHYPLRMGVTRPWIYSNPIYIR